MRQSRAVAKHAHDGVVVGRRMKIEQETAVWIDIANRRADDRMPGMIVQERHLGRKSTRQTEVAGIEAGDVVVAAAGDGREARVERGHDATIAVLPEEACADKADQAADGAAGHCRRPRRMLRTARRPALTKPAISPDPADRSAPGSTRQAAPAPGCPGHRHPGGRLDDRPTPRPSRQRRAAHGRRPTAAPREPVSHRPGTGQCPEAPSSV